MPQQNQISRNFIKKMLFNPIDSYLYGKIDHFYGKCIGEKQNFLLCMTHKYRHSYYLLKIGFINRVEPEFNKK